MQHVADSKRRNDPRQRGRRAKGLFQEGFEAGLLEMPIPG